MKPIRFIGTARDDLAAFPKGARTRAGHELFMVQAGRSPADWKPMNRIGPGTSETQKTARGDLDLAVQRYRIACELAEGAKRG
jgi:phage-related protein